MGLLLLIILCVLLYFGPAIAGRKKRNSTAIFWLNFLLGWTVAGWIVAFIWAMTKDAPPTQVIVNQPALASVLCASCGKYSQSDTKFCGMCGAQITS
jgi:hypothetical protein